MHCIFLFTSTAKSEDGDSADKQRADSEPGVVEAGEISFCRITPKLQAQKAELGFISQSLFIL